MAAEKIYMKHPEIEKHAATTRRAFETVWEPKGWVEVDPAAALAAEALGHEVRNLGALGREELNEAARAAGISDPESYSNKGELVDAINLTLNQE